VGGPRVEVDGEGWVAQAHRRHYLADLRHAHLADRPSLVLFDYLKGPHGYGTANDDPARLLMSMRNRHRQRQLRAVGVLIAVDRSRF